ncbi:ATPase [Paenibacillus sp. D9]|uniref:N-acetylglucosamine kinase n=1 Tax=Paenibacillus sp. D9 TaxID=665792 RepID=UPI00061DF8A5|nr:BadF/BadG/BcrA/BcrD ATPase family protein [Paenibacillus sp. D9]KKC48510.1 ATPase [Paenibacillus sp. D9]
MSYVAGLDGGGTKTAVAVADERGEVIHSFPAGPLNYNGHDEQRVEASIREICRGLETACGSLAAVTDLCIGAAGVSNPSAGGRLQAALRAGGYGGALTLAGDHETALAGAHGRLHGIVLIAGTGSICYGRSVGGAAHRAGGFGHLIDDEGSGYSIGRGMLSSVVRAADGRIGPTALTELVYGALGIGSVPELIGYVYAPGRSKAEIAALAPLLGEACDASDEAALRLAADSGAALASLVPAVATALGMEDGELALLGSVLERSSYVREAFRSELSVRLPRLRCVEPKRDAAYGAVLLALEARRCRLDSGRGGEGR